MSIGCSIRQAWGDDMLEVSQPADTHEYHSTPAPKKAKASNRVYELPDPGVYAPEHDGYAAAASNEPHMQLDTDTKFLIMYLCMGAGLLFLMDMMVRLGTRLKPGK